MKDTAADFTGLIDKILSHFAGEGFGDEIKAAKQSFFDNAGILEENSPHYELRMCQFFDWYFFTRPLRGFGQTVLESAHLTRELRFSEDERRLIEQMRQAIHGLFEFTKIKNEDVHLKNLLTNKKHVVRSSPFIYGFDADEIFEARLIPSGEELLFSRGFCFHPRPARRFILAQIKKFRKNPDLNPEDLMLRLMKMRYKYERYRHVDIGQIYSDENRVGL